MSGDWLNGRKELIMDPLKPTASVLSKIGSIAVHAEEMFSESGHAFDKVALMSLLADTEVQGWLYDMQKMALLPVKR